jgi:two-component system phosphate regulon sensor histidine kinase PhoR
MSVEDTGTGIPSESLEKIFHRFYRVDKARSRDLGGTGLGLAIVKHLMRLHGGTVRAESELGHGSRFVLEFPPA